MGATTEIQWADSTVNFWRVCTPVGEGCKNCYAAALSKRTGGGEYKSGVPRQRTSAKYWRDALKMAQRPFYSCPSCSWRGDRPVKALSTQFRGYPECPGCHDLVAPARRRIFALSLGDWLDNEVPIEWVVDALDVIRRSPQSDWLLLTKRVGNWRSRLLAALRHVDGMPVVLPINSALFDWINQWLAGNPPANVWLGATVVNQDEADRDVPKLLRVPARVRFLSVEPMLGPIELPIGRIMTGFPQHIDRHGNAHVAPLALHWIIAGGESGPHARPIHPDWVRSLRDQCAAAGIPYHFKQHGEWAPALAGMWFYPLEDCPQFTPRAAGKDTHDFGDGIGAVRVGKKAAGRVLDGVEHNGFPVPR